MSQGRYERKRGSEREKGGTVTGEERRWRHSRTSKNAWNDVSNTARDDSVVRDGEKSNGEIIEGTNVNEEVREKRRGQ